MFAEHHFTMYVNQMIMLYILNLFHAVCQLNKIESKKHLLSLISPVHKGSIIIMIPYDYTVEVTNRFKGLDLIDRVPEELWKEVHDTVQEAVFKNIPKRKKCKRARRCLRRPYK